VDALLAGGADVNERTPPEGGSRNGGGNGGGGGGNGGGGGGAKNGLRNSPLGDSMLVVAIVNGHFGLADFLLNKGADPNAAGARWSSLHALARVRNYEEAQYPPPMLTPGDLDSMDLAKHLLEHGANPSARSTTTTVKKPGPEQNYVEFMGATPFFLAAKSADISLMRLLLSAHADYSSPTDEHTTPLMVAAGIGCVPGQWIEPEPSVLEAVKILVEELKADVRAVNDRNETALHGAVCRGADSVVQYLVDKGANLDAKDVEAMTPLDAALQGLDRPLSVGGPKEIILSVPEHTAVLLKKLTAARHAASSASASSR
jgi:ankyrin repeat protein